MIGLLLGCEFLVLVKESIIVLAFGDIFWCVACIGNGVKDQAQLATLGPWCDTVHADVEFSAVLRVGKLWMRVAELCCALPGFLGADVVKPLASCPACLVLPVANSFQIVKDGSNGADVLLRLTILAFVENVAHRFVGMGVDPVQSWAQICCSLGGLQIKTVAAVDLKVVVAGLRLVSEVQTEDVAIGTELGNLLALITVVVLVTLVWILKKAVGVWWAHETLADNC